MVDPGPAIRVAVSCGGGVDGGVSDGNGVNVEASRPLAIRPISFSVGPHASRENVRVALTTNLRSWSQMPHTPSEIS